MSGLQQICKDKKEKLGISSAEIAEKSGLAVSTVRNFFNGTQKSPAVQTVVLICKVLNVSLDEYFGIGKSERKEQDNESEIELLRSGIKYRNKVIRGIFITFLVLLVVVLLAHLVYYGG